MQTELNDLQKTRIRFHLGYLWNLHHLSTMPIEERLRLSYLPLEIIRLTVGDIEILEASLVVLEGTPIATTSSILGKVELAYSNLSPLTVDASLFVAEAGKTKLRGNELANRKALYKSLVFELSKALGVPIFDTTPKRAGY
jgi:hypothetical protein